MSADECANLDYEEIRSALFEEIFTSKGSSAFQVYWNGFRSFIIGKLSKEEFDIIVHRTLEENKGVASFAFNPWREVFDVTFVSSAFSFFAVHLHNRLVMIMLNRINMNACQCLELRSSFAKEILKESSVPESWWSVNSTCCCLEFYTGLLDTKHCAETTIHFSADIDVWDGDCITLRAGSMKRRVESNLSLILLFSWA